MPRFIRLYCKLNKILPEKVSLEVVLYWLLIVSNDLYQQIEFTYIPFFFSSEDCRGFSLTSQLYITQMSHYMNNLAFKNTVQYLFRMKNQELNERFIPHSGLSVKDEAERAAC